MVQTLARYYGVIESAPVRAASQVIGEEEEVAGEGERERGKKKGRWGPLARRLGCTVCS